MKPITVILMTAALCGCATSPPSFQSQRTVWMRTDGRSAAGNPAMIQAFEQAKVSCAMNGQPGPGVQSSGGEPAVSRLCMADHGYVLVPANEVEARAAEARAKSGIPSSVQ